MYLTRMPVKALSYVAAKPESSQVSEFGTRRTSKLELAESENE